MKVKSGTILCFHLQFSSSTASGPPSAVHALRVSAGEDKKVRQPKLPHKKRKLRLSPNKIARKRTSVYLSFRPCMEFAFLSNSLQNRLQGKTNYALPKKGARLALLCNFVWQKYDITFLMVCQAVKNTRNHRLEWLRVYAKITA